MHRPVRRRPIARIAAVLAMTLAVAPGGPSATAVTWSIQQLPQTGPTGWGTDQTGWSTGLAGGGPGLVAAGSDAASGASWTSSNGGATWVEHLVPGNGGFGGLTAARGTFLAWATNGFWTSRDGVAWSRSGPGGIRAAATASGLGGFVAITVSAGGTTRAWTSTTGISWHPAADQAALHGFSPASMVGTSSRVIAVGASAANRARILVSTDGRTWRTGAVPAGLRSPAFASVSYAGGAYRLIGEYRDATHAGTAVWSSTTGLTWTRRSFVPAVSGWEPDHMGPIVKTGSAWFSAGDAGLGDAVGCALRVWRTTDLVHWSRVGIPSPPSGGTCTYQAHLAATPTKLVVTADSWDELFADGAWAWVTPTP